MKIVKLYDTIYEINTLYHKANTPAQRALAGYIIKSGKTQDSIFGGAFQLLCDVERCMRNEDIYMIHSYVDRKTESMISHVAQKALNGDFNAFVLRKADIEAIVKALSEIHKGGDKNV